MLRKLPISGSSALGVRSRERRSDDEVVTPACRWEQHLKCRQHGHEGGASLGARPGPPVCCANTGGIVKNTFDPANDCTAGLTRSTGSSNTGSLPASWVRQNSI
jgi:hypothetical protein